MYRLKSTLRGTGAMEDGSRVRDGWISGLLLFVVGNEMGFLRRGQVAIQREDARGVELFQSEAWITYPGANQRRSKWLYNSGYIRTMSDRATSWLSSVSSCPSCKTT
jgi:hypothetical protein